MTGAPMLTLKDLAVRLAPDHNRQVEQIMASFMAPNPLFVLIGPSRQRTRLERLREIGRRCRDAWQVLRGEAFITE